MNPVRYLGITKAMGTKLSSGRESSTRSKAKQKLSNGVNTDEIYHKEHKKLMKPRMHTNESQFVMTESNLFFYIRAIRCHSSNSLLVSLP